LIIKDEIRQELKGRIIGEEYSPGQWIIEREICKKYGLSRTPVREILRNLVSDGLLELQPAKGYLVRKLSWEEVVAIFQAREGVEGMAAWLTCRKSNQEFFLRLEELRDQLERVDIEKNPSQGVSIGNTLHNLIIETADNFLLSQFYQKLQNMAALTRNITRKSTSIEEKSKEDHLAIITALEEKDEVKSEQLLREHLRTTCRLLLETYYERHYPSKTLLR
jgi:DNA-binding GntR family transcriptional regulator